MLRMLRMLVAGDTAGGNLRLAVDGHLVGHNLTLSFHTHSEPPRRQGRG
jgi:hypothetical protein